MYSVQDSVKQGGRALIAKNFFGLNIYIERFGVLKRSITRSPVISLHLIFSVLNVQLFKEENMTLVLREKYFIPPKGFAPCSFSFPPFPFIFPFPLKEKMCHIFPQKVFD